nr:alpha/beta hydrolase [Liquorilactobacillus satsumensis]
MTPLEQLRQSWAQTAQKDQERIFEQEKPKGAFAETGYSYIAHGSTLQTLNLYFPQKSESLKPLPTIIDIHGGGWMYGNRRLNENYCRFLAAQGYAVMAMSYRLFPEVGLKQMMADIFASLHWLEHFGPQKDCNLNKVYLVGDSAGAHLAGLAACLQASTKLQRIFALTPVNFEFTKIALINGGVMEPTRLAEGKGGLMSKTADLQLELFEKQAPEIAPFIDFSKACSGLKLPPILVIGGENDSFWWQTELLIATLNETGGALIKPSYGRKRMGHILDMFSMLHIGSGVKVEQQI